MPRANVWVSDIYDDAMRFQKEVFGVHAMRTERTPSALVFPCKYDVIFVASLFSHLPAPRFKDWAQYLVEQLEEDGILIFSTHSPWTIPTGLRRTTGS